MSAYTVDTAGNIVDEKSIGLFDLLRATYGVTQPNWSMLAQGLAAAVMFGLMTGLAILSDKPYGQLICFVGALYLPATYAVMTAEWRYKMDVLHVTGVSQAGLFIIYTALTILTCFVAGILATQVLYGVLGWIVGMAVAIGNPFTRLLPAALLRFRVLRAKRSNNS